MRAETWFLDLSRAANRGFNDEKADDGLGGWTDQGPEADFKEFPTGTRDFLGVPFHILNPASNGGKAAVILKGRFRPDFPETATASADGRKAGWLYFLHTCAWPGTDRNLVFARYEILYRDGTALNIPLRVGIETAGTWGPGAGDACRTAWTRKVAAAAVGTQLFGWPNPHPDKALERVTLRSLGKSTVPILLAVTGSTKALELKEPFEEALVPEGEAWPELQAGFDAVFPVDVSEVLKGAPKGPWTIRKGRFVDAKDRRVRWLGLRLPSAAWDVSPENRAGRLRWMSANGFNLAVFRWDWALEAGKTEGLGAWCRDLKALGFTLMAEFPPAPSGKTDGVSGNWKTFWDAPPGGVSPDLGLLEASTPEEAQSVSGLLRSLGVRIPLGAVPVAGAARPYATARALDFCVGGFDWDEPVSGPDGVLRFSNQSILSHPVSAPLREAAYSRVEGKPFLARGGGAWPNLQAVEWPLFAAVAASFQDWDGLLVETPDGGWDGRETRPSPYASLWAASALLLRRGDVPSPSTTARVPSPDGESGYGTEEALKLALTAHRIFSCQCPGLVPSSRTDLRLRKVVAGNGRWEWQGNIGLFRAGSPRSQVLAGFLANRRLDNYAWAVETRNLFGVFALTSLTDAPTSSSPSLLVTGTARQECGGARFNAARTALLASASGAWKAEPLKAKVTVFRVKAESAMRARAYDAAGRVTVRAVPLTWKGKAVSFKWPTGCAWVILETGFNRVR